MEPGVLIDIAIITAATLVVGALIAVGLICIHRSRQWKRHRKIARQKRHDAARIDVSAARAAERPEHSARSRRRHRHSRSKHFTIDIVKREASAQEEPPPDPAAAAEERRPGGGP